MPNFAHFNFKFFAMVYDLNWTHEKLAQANPGILRKIHFIVSTDVEANQFIIFWLSKIKSLAIQNKNCSYCASYVEKLLFILKLRSNNVLNQNNDINWIFFLFYEKKNIFLRQQIFFSIFDQLNFKFFWRWLCELNLKLHKFIQADPAILWKIPTINLK